MKKHKDQIDLMLRGDPIIPPPPPVEDLPEVREGRGYAKKEGLRYWGTPEHKALPPATMGEEEVRYRSRGKGKHGLPADAKRGLSEVARELRRVLEPENRQWLARKYLEWGEREQDRLEKAREEHKESGRTTVLWGDRRAKKNGEPIDRATYIAKELRSGMY